MTAFAVIAFNGSLLWTPASQFANPGNLGTELTLLTIRMIPPIESAVGWEWAFTALAIGPFIGMVAMWRLRRSPDRAKLAGGAG